MLLHSSLTGPKQKPLLMCIQRAMNLTAVVNNAALTLLLYLQVVGVSWLNDQALAVVSEQGPRSHVHLYDASGAPLSATAAPSS